MSEVVVDLRRRRFLTGVTTGVGLAGVGTAMVPFVKSMSPSDRARAAGAPVEIDISKLEKGQMLTIEWRGKPVWVLHRSEEMLASLSQLNDQLADPNSERKQQPEYAMNEARSIRPEILVLIGICTHLGCAPFEKFEIGPVSGLGEGWLGGFFCPCHGSKFDLAGRVYKSVPAPTNMVVPPYSYISQNRILVGVGGDQGETS